MLFSLARFNCSSEMVSITYLNSSSPPSDSGSIQSDTQSDAYNDSEGMLTELVAAPESSSTVVPSSPVIQTAPSVMRISPKPCQLRSVQRAAFPALGKAKLAAEDSDLDPLPEIVPNEGFTPKRSLAFENELSLPKSRSSRKSSHSSSGSSRYERHPSHSYYPMDTVESQLRFTRHLDKFLLRLLSQQQVGPLSRIRRSLSLSQSISQSPCDSGASATSSLYAADVSLAQSFGDSVVSSLSSSRSTSCSVSSAASLADIDAPSAYTQKSDNLSSSASPGYDIQTPMRFDAQLVYGSVSDGDEAEAAIDVDEGLPPIQPEARSVALAVNRLGTPLPSNDLKTPAAPKKTQHHFYPLVPNGLALPPRKRARFSKSDQPAQDHLKTGECMRNEPFSTGSSGERIAYSHRVSPVDTFIAVSCGDTASQGPISSQTVPDSQDIPLVPSLTGLLVCVPASFRRAASLRSDPSATKTIAFGDSGMERIAKPSPSPTSMTGAARTERNAATCPPTQPVTPATKMSTSKKSPTLSPFPVLSPSAFGSACRAPIYAADAAEARIKALVKRELADRRFDALLEGTIVFSEEAPPASVDSDTEMWRALGEDVSGGVLRLRDGDMHDDISENVDHYKTEDIPLFLGVEEDLRIKVVEWILDVRSPHTPVGSLKNYLQIMPPANLPKKNAFAHLRAQLTEAPDTRWHAAHLVTRYFFEIGTSEPPSPSTEPTSQHAGSPRVLQGREALTWDIGVACLALSVKVSLPWITTGITAHKRLC